jgi:hypothetical protein
MKKTAKLPLIVYLFLLFFCSTTGLYQPTAGATLPPVRKELLTQSSSPNSCVTILDTLGVTPPTSKFSVFASSGISIFRVGSVAQLVGPEFTLSQAMVITEIGAFLNNCITIIEGTSHCPDTSPVLVQIRPSLNGIPDPNTVIASFTLSHDNDPFAISYESVSVFLPLPAGTYFAVFAPQNNDGGFLLGAASSPFTFIAGKTRLGLVLLPSPPPNTQLVYDDISAAIRILGNCLLDAHIDIKPGSSTNSINLKSRGKIPVAILGSTTFDVTTLNINSIEFSGAAPQIDQTSFQDVNGDGVLDVVLHFRTQDLVLSADDSEACVTGKTITGQSFRGCDTIKIVP